MTSLFRRRWRSARTDQAPDTCHHLALPPPPATSPSPRWGIGSLLSGAGKLISSVFRSDSESSQPYTDYSDESSSDGGISDSSYDDEDEILTGNKEVGLNQRTDKYIEGCLAIVPKTDCKIAIEQMLKQETFSREECDRLTKLIHSRVVEFSSPEVDYSDKQQVNMPDGAVAWSQQSEDRVRFPESSSYFSSKFGTFILASPLQACSPELRDKAITEAKRYLEKKNSKPSSMSNIDHGPCRLNTDMLHYGIEDRFGSPVDMAKSYMQSLPPWQSPFWSASSFKTPSPRSVPHSFQKETTHYSLPTFEALKKRSYSAIEPDDFLDKARRIRQKTMELLSNGQKEAALGHPMDTDMASDENIPHLENGSEAKHTDLADSQGAIRSKLSENETQMDPREPIPTEEGRSIYEPHSPLIQASTLEKHDELLSEAEVIPSEQMKIIEQSNHDAMIQESCTPLQDGESLQTRSSSHQNKGDSVEQLEPQNGNFHSLANGSRDRIAANGSSMNLEMTSRPTSHPLTASGKSDAANSSTSEYVASNVERNLLLREMETDNVRNPSAVSSSMDQQQNGTTMKSIERMLGEPELKSREKKKVVRSRRGRRRWKSRAN